MRVDTLAGEKFCAYCGFVSETRIAEYTTVHHENEGGYSKERGYTSKLGGKRNDCFEIKDYSGKQIDVGVKADLVTASKFDREKLYYESRAVKRIIDLYETVLHQVYDEGLKKFDLEILKQRARTMVEITGQKQTDLDLLKIIRNFVKNKLKKNLELKEHFKLNLLHMKIRHQQEQPINILGRGNQINKNRKERRIEYCNLCNVKIPNYKARQHHSEHHLDIQYYQFIDMVNNYVRRSAKLENVSVDGSANKNNENKIEYGVCLCGYQNARYIRDKLERKKGRGVGEKIARLRIFHPGLDGKIKLCKSKSRVLNRKYKKNTMM